MNEAAHEAETIVVEIRLRDGETIKAKTKDTAGTSIGGLHQTLQGSEFVQVGEDTIVRSADVQSIQIRDRDLEWADGHVAGSRRRGRWA